MNRPTAQIYANYTAEDFSVWKTLFNRQMDILNHEVSKQFIKALDDIRFSDEKIPDFIEVNDLLQKSTGWKVEVVPNLCPEQKFFECLAQQSFTSTCWLRTMEQLDYLEEPDMFHDVFGHMPLLTNHNYANFFTDFGKIALRYIDNPLAIQLLSRIYWYTIEFGLIEEEGSLKIYGAGIISSNGETKHAIDSGTVKQDFEIETLLNTPYRTDVIQDKYFVVKSFEHLYATIPEIESCLIKML